MNVGPAEAVDRLLGIADQVDEISTVTLDEHPLEERPLKFVGILKLVDQGEPIAGSHRPDQLAAVRAVELRPRLP